MNDINKNDFYEVINRIETAKNRAFSKVNEELIMLYWDIGHMISYKLENSEWGNKVVDDLAVFIKNNYPEIKGFTRSNLYRMKQFYETYKDNEIVAPLVGQLSWTNNLMILSKAKTVEEREFYIRLCIKERYSKRDLERQIESSVYERTMLGQKSTDIINRLVPQNMEGQFKDTYMLEFLDLPANFDEADLHKSLIDHLKAFLMELGAGFSFIGSEYKVQVGNHDYFIDMLFYNRNMQCLVAIELKVVEFKPEFLGKMNFYLEALDRDIKMEHENPSIGILLCKSKDDEVVEYALSRSISPTVIADYETKILGKDLLKQKLHEWTELYIESIEKKDCE
jgi:predicted nuclease of restriction endonuclease-like (RecB) superfamily